MIMEVMYLVVMVSHSFLLENNMQCMTRSSEIVRGGDSTADPGDIDGWKFEVVLKCVWYLPKSD
jgi:hypothetical protein